MSTKRLKLKLLLSQTSDIHKRSQRVYLIQILFTEYLIVVNNHNFSKN